MQAGNFLATRSWHPLPALRGYPADRKPLKFRRGVQTELLFDVRAMHIHGLGAEMEPAGNFVCAPAFAVEPQDFQLAIGELGFRPGLSFSGWTNHRFQNF